MLEQNRQEITELRGLVEQLTFEVEQLKKQSKERYIDLDRRLPRNVAGGGTTTRNGAVGSGGVAQYRRRRHRLPWDLP